MGFLLGMFKALKDTLKLRRVGKRLVEEQNATFNMIKEKIVFFAKALFKAISIQFLIATVVFVLLISMVGIIFQFFGFIQSEGIDDLESINTTEILINFAKEDLEDMQGFGDVLSEEDLKKMEELAEVLSDEDIEELQEFGAMVHPRKVPTYFEIEDQSYQKNVGIKVPVETTITFNGKSVGESVSYTDYFYTRGDTAYPFRQWWQSTTGLDAINDTASKEDETELIEDARIELKPIFSWSDPVTPFYNPGDIYEKTGEYQEIDTFTTTKDSHYIMTGVNVIEKTNTEDVDKKGPGKVEVYPEDMSWTDTEIIKEVTTKPLPFLYDVETMFALHKFKYKAVQKVSTSGQSFSGSVTMVKNVLVDGVIKKANITYSVSTEVGYALVIDSFALSDEDKEYISRFFDFLKIHEIDTIADPWVMYLMADTLPQNYDFIEQYEGYLGFIEAINEFRHGQYQGEFFEGDFGVFEGGEFLFPLESYKKLTSYFGYRVDPFNPSSGKMKFHSGIDFSAYIGTNILAAADGIVSYSGINGSLTSGYGYLIEINHGSGLTTRYGHCSKILVSNGEKVTKGQVIGKVGSTGSSTGPHLHFEVRKDGIPTDPLPWIMEVE